MLDFRIKTFLAVCRAMNFTRAAESLHITQPAVSQHIRALEEEYHTKLFLYEGKRLSLTEAGMLFFKTAAAMEHDARHLRDAISHLTEKRRLCFGATLTVAEYNMPDPLLRLLEREPEIRLRMMTANTAELLRLLDEGEIDFAIVEGFFQKQFYESLPYKRERYLAVCAPGYSFSRQPKRLEDLLGERLLIREPGSGTREVLERALEEQNLSIGDFAHLTELGSLGAIKSMVMAGAGISFFYEPAVRSEVSSGSLCEILLEEPPIFHEFSFLWRKGSVFSSFYQDVFQLFQPAEGASGIEAFPAKAPF